MLKLRNVELVMPSQDAGPVFGTSRNFVAVRESTTSMLMTISEGNFEYVVGYVNPLPVAGMGFPAESKY